MLVSDTNYRKTNNIKPLNFRILKAPLPGSLIRMQTRTSHNYCLYYNAQKKQNVAMQTGRIERQKLMSHLQVYQWRHQTQFPIVRVKYVDVNLQTPPQQKFVNLNVFTQYCPVKLSHLYDINLGQTLYLLKESIIGFQRLYNRFGGFQITNSMISINQKGYCRVWINENIFSNFCQPSKANQKSMVQDIIKLIQIHSNQSKGSKNIFAALKDTKSFLSALKVIQTIVKLSRILVPSKFLFLSQQKYYPKSAVEIVQQYKTSKPIQSLSSIRLSIKSTKPQTKQRQSPQKTLQRTKSGKRSGMSPGLIKRFKSQDKIYNPGMMKNSQGETTHSRNIKSSNTGPLMHNQTFENAQKKTGHSEKKKTRKWIEQSSFMMGTEVQLPVSSKKQKKQLSYSQAFKSYEPNLPYINQLDRKLSVNFVNNLNARVDENKKSNNFGAGSMAYALQFKQILGAQDKCSGDSSIHSAEDIEQKKQRWQHTDNIIKVNGWNIAPDLLVSSPKELKSSFHQGEEVSIINRNVKLDKLGKMGRRQIIMSLLPEQGGDFY